MKKISPVRLGRLSSKYSLSGIILAIIFIILGSGKIPVSWSDSPSLTPTPVQVDSRIIKNHEASTSATAYVVKVVDGDTITVSVDGKKETVRLIGIDTPEVVDPRRLVQCFGREASEKTKEILTDKQIILVDDQSQGNRDKYNRLLRYVYLDNININKQLVQEGYAHEYTYRLPYVYQSEFIEAERIAREGKKGLWADEVCPATTITPSSP